MPCRATEGSASPEKRVGQYTAMGIVGSTTVLAVAVLLSGANLIMGLTVATNTANEVAAARYRRVKSRYAAKIAGVSFRPIASPIPTPFQRELSARLKSYSTSAPIRRSSSG